MRRVVCILGLLCYAVAAGAVPLGLPPAPPPPPENDSDVELTGQQERAFDSGSLGNVAASERAKVTLGNGRSGIVTASGHASITVTHGQVAGIRSNGDARVILRGGVIADAPFTFTGPPILRASGRSRVSVAGAAVYGRVAVSESAMLDVATGGISPGPGADPQLTVSDDGEVHFHGRWLACGRTGADGRSGYYRLAGVITDGVPLTLTVQILGRGKIVLHSLDGQPAQTIHAVGMQPSTQPASAVKTKVRTAASVPVGLIIIGIAAVFGLALLRYRLAGLLSLASLVLLVAVATLWLRSYRHADTLTRHALTPRPGVNHHHTISLQSAGGGLRLHLRSHPAANGIPEVHRADLSTQVNWEWRSIRGPKTPAYPITSDEFAAAGPFARKWRLLLLDGQKPTGFAAHADRQMTIVVPLWVIALPLAVPPLLYLYAFARRRRRFAANHCRTCGYDLRASSGRCPECGTRIETASAIESEDSALVSAAAP